MKPKSVAGIVCYVQNIAATVAFYEYLGFHFKRHEPTHATGYINWFWIDFLQSDAETKLAFQAEARAQPKGAGQYLYLSVNDVDAAHAALTAAGLTPSTEPTNQPWGNREFVIRDPDGYKLVVFKRR